MQNGETALLCAAQEEHLQIVQELLKRGANIEAQDEVMWGDGALTLTPPLILTLTLILTLILIPNPISDRNPTNNPDADP